MDASAVGYFEKSDAAAPAIAAAIRAGDVVLVQALAGPGRPHRGSDAEEFA